MKLHLNPDDMPRHWAASKDRNWTVRRSPRPDELGRYAYVVHYHHKRGKVYEHIFRERWIQDLLQRICESFKVDKAEIVTDPVLWSYSMPVAERTQQDLFLDGWQAKKYKVVSEDEIQTMFDMYERLEGSRRQRCVHIGKVIGCSHSTVSNYLKSRKVAA